jgi:hypothetical protein
MPELAVDERVLLFFVAVLLLEAVLFFAVVGATVAPSWGCSRG